MSKDQAARIAAFSWTATIEPDNCELARRIRRAVYTAVRKERERCVKCVDDEFEGTNKYSRIRIVDAINGGKR